MKTIAKVPYEPVFIQGEEPIPEIMEQGKVYISEYFGTAIHLCLCGCGNKTVMPFGVRKGMWELVKENNGTVSFIGSVGNYCFPCQSHYIMTKNVANFV